VTNRMRSPGGGANVPNADRSIIGTLTWAPASHMLIVGGAHHLCPREWWVSHVGARRSIRFPPFFTRMAEGFASCAYDRPGSGRERSRDVPPRDEASECSYCGARRCARRFPFSMFATCRARGNGTRDFTLCGRPFENRFRRLGDPYGISSPNGSARGHTGSWATPLPTTCNGPVGLWRHHGALRRYVCPNAAAGSIESECFLATQLDMGKAARKAAGVGLRPCL